MTGPEAARRLLASSALRRVGQVFGCGDVFLTGGSLRDRLLSLPTHDLDITVNGDAQRAAAALATMVGGRFFPLGRPPLATWRVAGGRIQVDVWGITDGIEKDILRRDFTVNALVWRLPRGPLLDLVGGLEDLEAGRIRVVRPENLIDDPLRVLRGLRLLASHPQLRLTAETECHLRAAVRHLPGVAHERVCDELRKLLAGDAAARAIVAGERLGVLPLLFPAWEGFRHGADLARLAGALQQLRRVPRRSLSLGAAEVAPAILAAPSGGLPGEWQCAVAAAALVAVGWPPRAAQRSVEAAAFGERFLDLIDRDTAGSRRLAIEAGDLAEPALAWAVARGNLTGVSLEAPARSLLRWLRRFAARPPLLAGDEVADLLGLPPDASRGEAVSALRAARARGEVRTPGQARRFLLRRLLR
ncbi:MAG: hypothetical protein ABR961_10550 [Thermoanaerobaculaceae bacterium]